MSTRVRKKEILSDDFKKRKILWKKYCGKFSVRENFLWKIFHLTSLPGVRSKYEGDEKCLQNFGLKT
jgi:hypothetical protein